MGGRLKTALLALALFLLNMGICRELFGVEYLARMGSIEGVYIGLSRYVTEHWRDLAWYRLWYDGIPYQNTYPPLLHWCVALLAWLRGLSPAHAYHWATALAYCLAPVTLFALALRLSGSRWAAFAAGVIYSAVSPSAWLVPAIAADLGSPFHPRRLQTLVVYGDAPHIAALTLLPLAILFLDLALVTRRARYVVPACLSLAAIPLTNWLGAFALALAVIAYAAARIGRSDWRFALRIAPIVLAAYCLAMPWIPPSTIAVTQLNAQNIGGDFTRVYHRLPLAGLGMVAAALAIKLAARRLSPHLQFGIFFTLLTGGLTLAAAWLRIDIMPQAIRYHLELEMALALLAAFAAQTVLGRGPRWARWAVPILAAALLVQPLREARRYARNVLIRPIDITTTTEWRTAQWLNRNWSGERVMMPGSTSFWLGAFSDTPQLAGGFEAGATNYMVRVALFTIYYGTPYAGPRDGENSVLWLKAMGVEAVGVSGPRSGEFFKPFVDAKKFDGLLSPLWRDGDDVIYRVGAPDASLARIVPREALAARTPRDGLDVDPLRPYVAELDDPRMPLAQFVWTSPHSARILADSAPGQVISVQISWHRGWHAAANRRPIPVLRDGLGLIFLEPGPGRQAVIDLVYDGGTEMQLARGLSAGAVLALILFSARAILNKSW